MHKFGPSLLLLAWLGCSSSGTPAGDAVDPSGGDGSEQDGTSGDGSAQDGAASPGDGTPDAPGDECGRTELRGARLAPNLLIVLDRSGSMDEEAGDDTRWNAAKRAIETVTDEFEDEIRFGLHTYSSCLAGGCSAGETVVPIGAGQAGAIRDFLADKLDEGSEDGTETTADGVRYLCDSGDPETPTGLSLFALVGDRSLLEAERDNAVLLLTDGEESDACVEDGRDGAAGAQALRAQEVPVRTFVVGLGVNADSLDEIAEAGGTDQLLAADDEDSLRAALQGVARQAISCTLVLDDVPPDPAQVSVFFNDDPTPVPRDDPDGYRYDEARATVVFQGDSCEALRNQSVTDVDVVFGCPAPVVL